MTRHFFSLAATILALSALTIPTLAQDKMGGDKMGGSKKPMAGKMKCAECAKLTKKMGKPTACAACKKKMATKSKMADKMGGGDKMGGKM
jgi:hypothetical protein